MDYDQGKKIIKRLCKGADLPKPAEATPGSFYTDQSYAETNVSLRLPSPALNPRKPSLQFRRSSAVKLAGTSEATGTPSSESITDRSPLLDNDRIRTYGGEASVDGTPAVSQQLPLTTFTRNATDVFFNWLGGEVNKIEEFYREQEKEAVRRGDELKKQIDTLQKHRLLLKKKKQSAVPGPTLAWLDRLEFPSVPKCFSNKNDIDARNSHRDYGFRSEVNYTHAKYMLKRASYDYYQNLLKLKSYRALNETGIRKIVKKFDKTFQTSFLESYMSQTSRYNMHTSKQVDILTEDIIKLYAENFESGHHKYAVEKLQRGEIYDPHNRSVLLTGLLIGAGLPLFIRAIYAGVRDLHRGHEFAVRFYLQIWAGFFFIDLILLLLSLNLYAWQHFRINYMFIFELDRSIAMDYRQFPVLPASFFFTLSLLGWINFDVSAGKFGYYIPCLFLGLLVVAFAAPYPAFWSTRKWAMMALLRLVLSGLYPVEFRDFFVGDIFCSLNYSVSNMALFFCLYGKGSWWDNETEAETCGSSHSRVMGFLNCLPAIWRFLQCWRRFLDTYDWFPHLLNSSKYSATILYNLFLSYVRINEGNVTYRALFIVFAILNAVLSSLWDILMDFSLSIDLRPVLIYPRWAYYVAMFVDPLMRFHWVLYVVYWDQTQQSAKISFIVALIEVVRRFVWVFFRVENEHATNVGQSRAFKDLNLPYFYTDETPTPTQSPTLTQGSSATAIPSSRTQVVCKSDSASPRFTAVQRILRRAHTMDFERRQQVADTDQEDSDG